MGRWHVKNKDLKNEMRVFGVPIPTMMEIPLEDNYIIKLGQARLLFTENAKAVEQFIAVQKQKKATRNDSSGAVTPDSNITIKKKKSAKTAAIAVAVILVIMVSFCLRNHVAGNKKLAEEDYAAAISA